jgi:hypothetical protein
MKSQYFVCRFPDVTFSVVPQVYALLEGTPYWLALAYGCCHGSEASYEREGIYPEGLIAVSGGNH